MNNLKDIDHFVDLCISKYWTSFSIWTNKKEKKNIYIYICRVYYKIIETETVFTKKKYIEKLEKIYFL